MRYWRFCLSFQLTRSNGRLHRKSAKLLQNLPSPNTVPDGVLLVNIVSNLTIFPTSAVSSIYTPVPGYTSVNETGGFSGVAVYVYEGLSTQPSVQNITNSLGQVEENLSPNTYGVKLVDWRLNNLTVNVQIKSNEISYLNVTVNATSYVIESANIADPDFSGWVVRLGANLRPSRCKSIHYCPQSSDISGHWIFSFYSADRYSTDGSDPRQRLARPI